MRLLLGLQGKKIAFGLDSPDWDVGQSILLCAVLSVGAGVCVYVHVCMCLCTYVCIHTHVPLQTHELTKFFERKCASHWLFLLRNEEFGKAL